MKLPSRRAWLVLLPLFIPLACGGELAYRRYLWWDAYERPIVRHSWKVVLPSGGSVTYRTQSPRSRPIISPGDSQKFLLWQRPDGQTNDYLISQIGGDYNDVEFRLRPDGHALWLLSYDHHKIVATLDLQNGQFTDGGGNTTEWDAEGQNEGGPWGIPKWANWKSGRSLGRKKF